jgi:urease accessory protein
MMLHGPIAPIRLQRTTGAARVVMARVGGRTRLKGLRQEGSAKAFLPSVHGAVPEVVFLNTAGGLTGGDRLAFSLDVGPGAEAVATTQTAERAYASGGGSARLGLAMRVGAGARLDWLPQETILYDAASLERETEIALEGDAACLFAETVVLGRAAMGETVTRVAFRDARLVRRDGRAVHEEPLVLDDAVLAAAGGAAVLGGARAFATVVMVADGAEDAVGRARAALDGQGVVAAASGWGGRLVVRVAGGDGWPVRRQVARVLAALRGRPLPRVWQM